MKVNIRVVQNADWDAIVEGHPSSEETELELDYRFLGRTSSGERLKRTLKHVAHENKDRL